VRIEAVGDSPGKIAQSLIFVSPVKAAHVALIVLASVGPAIVTAARERLADAVERVQDRPAATAGKILSVLMEPDP
jgi:hypothetical protein